LTDARQALLEKARRAIRSAHLLRADGDYDSAVSRAYYAMFQEARNISDYQAVSHITEEATLQHISRAEQFLAAAKGLLKA